MVGLRCSSKRLCYTVFRMWLISVVIVVTLLIFCPKYWPSTPTIPNRCSVRKASECEQYESPPQWRYPIAKHNATMDLSRVLLVVHFNTPTYESSLWVKLLYEKIFADIVFCGPGNITNHQSTRGLNFVSYVNVSKHDPAFTEIVGQQGENFYVCIEEALSFLGIQNDEKIDNRFEGVLAMSDDVILNFWQLKADGFNTSNNWLMTPDPPYVFEVDTGNFCDMADCLFNGDEYWMWPAIYHLSLLAFQQEFISKPEWINAELELANLTYGRHRRFIGRTSADCFYISSRYLQQAIQLFHVFNKYRVYMEIAVPTTLFLISSGKNALQFIDTNAHFWATNDPNRPTAEEIYRTTFQLVHPFKMAKLFTSEFTTDGNCLYCALNKLTSNYAKLQRAHM